MGGCSDFLVGLLFFSGALSSQDGTGDARAGGGGFGRSSLATQGPVATTWPARGVSGDFPGTVGFQVN